MALAAPGGLYVAWREWRRSRLFLIVGWAAVVYAFHAGAPWQNVRFGLAYLPPMALLAATGMDGAWRALGRRRGIVAAFAVVGVLTMVVGGARLVQGFLDRKENDLHLVAWIEEEVPASAQLLSFGPTLTLQHYSTLQTLDLYDVPPGRLQAVLDQRTSTYLLLDEANVEQQWLGLAPDLDFRALRDRPGLVRVGQRGDLTLYRVGRE
jgi:hypothetical protein